MTSKKTIYLARHAKSAWNTSAPTDFDRPLSRRGQTDAVRIGAELKALDWLPEIIMASPALRARQTCLEYCKSLNIDEESIRWKQEIYAAYTIALLQCLTGLNENVSSVMLVGHNPSMEDLLIHLCGESSVSTLRQENGKLLTTANVVKISVHVQWKDLVMCEAKLLKIIRPKELS